MQRVVAILLLFSAYLLSAQSDQLFRNVKSEYGLASNSISSITQDEKGFIWIASAGGLFRYDGYEIIPFKNDRSTTIDHSKDRLNVIEKNSENEIWVGSQSGLLFFDTSTGANRKIELGGDRNIRCLLKQGDSVIWAGSNDGLFKINISDDSYVFYNRENSNISSDIIRSLYLTASNELWVGTFDGLNKLFPKGEFEFYNFKGDYKPELDNNLILDIQPYSKDNDSLLWVGTETGLVLFNTESKTYDVLNSQNTNILNEVVKCVYSKIPGQVYFGTDLGLYYYDDKTKEIHSSFHDPFDNYSIANNVVTDIFEDVSGFLWLSTNNGVSKLNYVKSKFEFTSVFSKYKNQIVGTQISNIYKDKNDDVWLSTTQGVKVLRKDGSTQEFTSDNDNDTKIVLNTVGSITGDALGRIWIGSSGGINIWDPKTEKMFTLTANFDQGKGLRTNYISSFIQPDDGSFWVSTWGGGIYKVQGDFSNLNDVSFRFMADFNSGMFAADKKIWAFDNQKIYTLDVKTNEVQSFDTLNEEIKELRISSILVSKRGELWIGATDELIKYQIQSDKVQKFQIKTGKSSLPYNLVEDHAGNIWGTTLTSIFKFSISSNTYEVYPMNYGVTLDNFIPGSHTVTRDGQLFFGGNDGFISFYPDEIKKSNFKPNLLITNLTIRGKDINSLNEIGDANETSKQVSFF